MVRCLRASTSDPPQPPYAQRLQREPTRPRQLPSVRPRPFHRLPSSLSRSIGGALSSRAAANAARYSRSFWPLTTGWPRANCLRISASDSPDMPVRYGACGVSPAPRGTGPIECESACWRTSPGRLLAAGAPGPLHATRSVPHLSIDGLGRCVSGEDRPLATDVSSDPRAEKRSDGVEATPTSGTSTSMSSSWT